MIGTRGIGRGISGHPILKRDRDAPAQPSAAHGLFADGKKLGAQPVAQQHRCISSPDKRAGAATGVGSFNHDLEDKESVSRTLRCCG